MGTVAAGWIGTVILFAGLIVLQAVVENPIADEQAAAYQPPDIPWIQLSVPVQVREPLSGWALGAFAAVAFLLDVSVDADLRIDCGRATCTATVAPALKLPNKPESEV